MQVEIYKFRKRIYKEDKCGIRIVYLVQWVDLDIMDFLGRKKVRIPKCPEWHK